MANLQSLQLKVNQLAKDFGLKGKDISDALAANGIEVKTTQSTLTPEQFGMLLETLSKSHQITHIEDYIDGVTYIPSRKKKRDAAPKPEDAPVEVPLRITPTRRRPPPKKQRTKRSQTKSRRLRKRPQAQRTIRR